MRDRSTFVCRRIQSETNSLAILVRLPSAGLRLPECCRLRVKYVVFAHRYVTMAILSCTFCGESQARCEKLIAGPTVYICDRCVLAAPGVSDEAGSGWSSVGSSRPEATLPCSFCAKARSNVRSMFTRAGHRMCGHCLLIALEILRSEGIGPSSPRRIRRESAIGRFLRAIRQWLGVKR